MKLRFSNSQLIEAIKDSSSIRQVLSKLGLVEAGGNYTTIKKRILSLGIDISHFTGKGWKKEKHFPTFSPKPLSELLQKGVYYQSYKLKKRLFAEKLKFPICENCLLTEWVGKPIPLELDHINGDKTDNRLENLKILCPNCHALTNTYRGKKLAKCRDLTAPA